MISVLAAACCQHAFAQRDILFSQGWEFGRGAAEPIIWTPVDLPHDFSMMPAYSDSALCVGPFSTTSEGKNHTGYTKGGTGWYRKHFAISPSNADKSVIIDFDGAYMETTVWINGSKAIEHKYGYTPFCIDATPYLNAPGEDNLIMVRVDNIGANSRWYSGSGIYRNVRMHLVPKARLAQWGVSVTTPNMRKDDAQVNIDISLINETGQELDANLDIKILDNKGALVTFLKKPTRLQPGTSPQTMTLRVHQPSLWSVDTPTLYSAMVTVETAEGKDTYIQPFGFRKIEYSAEKGFLINGTPTLLRGGCLHHDNGFLGAAAIKAAEVRRVKLMKENGYNAIRCSHNPPSREFLEACDSLGMLVIDEFVDMWHHYKNPNDYAQYFKDYWRGDLESMLLRDRNHPSIVMWSIGNEIPASSTDEISETAQEMREFIHQYDTTRPITQGVPSFLALGGWAKSAPYFSNLDICGYNYLADKYVPDHEQYPDRIMYASESYPRDAYKHWRAVEDHPWVIGDFVWTAMDYIGEVAVGHSQYVDELNQRPGLQDRDGLPEGTQPEHLFDLMNSMAPDKWPLYQSGCGDIDIIGHKKSQGLYRDVLWGNSPIEMVVHEPVPEGKIEEVTGWGWPRELKSWNWEGSEGRPLQVHVFSSAPRIRLLLNGEQIDERPCGEAMITAFDVTYQPGELKAQAIDAEGAIVGETVLTTHSRPTKIQLNPDQATVTADRNDLVFIDISLLDDKGNLTVANDELCHISIDGEGELVASGNADILGMADVNQPSVHTYRGRAQAIVRPFAKKGQISVKVSSPGLPTSTLTIPVMSVE